MLCPKCKAPIPANAPGCRRCGGKTARRPPPARKKSSPLPFLIALGAIGLLVGGVAFFAWRAKSEAAKQADAMERQMEAVKKTAPPAPPPAEPPKPVRRHEVGAYGLSLPVPDGWEVAPAGDGIAMLQRPDPGAAMSIKAQTAAKKLQSGEMTWEQFVEQTKTLYKSQIPGFQFAESKVSDDRSRCTIIYRMKPVTAAAQVVHQTWVNAPQYLFLATAAAPATEFERLRKELDAIAAGITVK